MNQLSAPVWEAANHLEQTWQAATERWQDSTAAEFEQQHWLPLAATALDDVTAAHELEELLATIRVLANELQ